MSETRLVLDFLDECCECCPYYLKITRSLGHVPYCLKSIREIILHKGRFPQFCPLPRVIKHHDDKDRTYVEIT